jgi:type IV pilus assembly protein PilB
LPIRRKSRDTQPKAAPELSSEEHSGRDLEIERDGSRLGELLIRKKAISSAQLVEALVQQDASGKKVGSLLVEVGALDERTLANVLAEQLDLEVIDLRKEAPQENALSAIPEHIARGLVAIPVHRQPNVVDIAVADPSPEVQQELEKAAGMKVRLLMAPSSDIRRAIDNSYRILGGVQTHIEAFEATAATRKQESQLEHVAASEGAPVVQVVNLLITQGLRDRASDIHLEPQDGRTRVRYRVDGALHDIMALPSAMAPALASRIKIMGDMNIVERQRPQDGQIELNIDGRPLDVRVSTAPTIWGEKVVMRLLDKSKPLFHIEDLGMSPEVQERYLSMTKTAYGMMVVAGPTGSGKTTSLYASLGEVNSTERNIMTVEDPVEYVFPSINQIQIKEQAGVSFADGLKAILRQDPDVILVGEIRDVDTARIAVQSALTGHFVFSSIHATDAVSAIHRFLDMGIESFLVASAITGVVGQRLLRRICPHCIKPYKPSPDELAFFDEAGGDTKATFKHGKGCNFCFQTGYQERVGVFELLQVTNEIKQLVVRHAAHEKILDQGIKQGMVPLKSEALRLVEEGITTIPEVIKSIYNV